MTEMTFTEDMYVQRIFIMFIFAFILFTIVGLAIGSERKAKWFKKRTKYSFFNRRSIISEFIHFGRPCTWEGLVITIAMLGFILGFGYWFVFYSNFTLY